MGVAVGLIFMFFSFSFRHPLLPHHPILHITTIEMASKKLHWKGVNLASWIRYAIMVDCSILSKL